MGDLPGLLVQEEERGQQPAARFQHPRDLGRVMFELFSQEIGKERVRDGHIESSILIRKAKLRRAKGPTGIVDSIADVGDVQGGALVPGHPILPGPKHMLPLRIEAFIFTAVIEIVPQSDRQPPIIAADIQEAASRRQPELVPAKICELDALLVGDLGRRIGRNQRLRPPRRL